MDKDLDIPIFRDISEDARKRILYPDHILVVKPHPHNFAWIQFTNYKVYGRKK